jgi:probable F420-dependent oxidoreductase
MDLGRIGIWSGHFRGPVDPEAAEAVAELDELGFGALWIPGGADREILTYVTQTLAASTRLVVATGILNVWMQTADEVAALHAAITAAHPGRFLLGLGVSHAPAVEATDRVYERPLAVIETFLDGLDAAPTPVPVAERALAALGPRMLELARDRSAGAHPYLANPEHTARCREVLGTGPLLAPEQMVVVDDDLEVVRSIGRQHVGRYLRLPNYTNNLRRLGFGDADLADGGSDRLIDAIVVGGGLDRIADRVDGHLAAGADHVCLQVLAEDPGPRPVAAWRQLSTLVDRPRA